MTASERLTQFEKDLEKQFPDLEIMGTADEYHNTKETYCGLAVFTAGSEIDGEDVAVDHMAYVNPKLEKFLDENGYWYESSNGEVGCIYRSGDAEADAAREQE